MNILKRNKKETKFDKRKIVSAITKANNDIDKSLRISNLKISNMANRIESKCSQLKRTVTVEEVQDMVEKELVDNGNYYVAKAYITYRHVRDLARRSNTTDDKILSLVDFSNDEINEENSNKNPTRASTQRDYMAGEVSKDLTERVLLPKDIVDAHKAGIIHFHDADYFANHIHNCELINLEDMLQNGTVITDTAITKPHSLLTAANVTTQIIAQVASNTYGGQTFSLSFLAPFVDVSRKKYIDEIRSEMISENIPIEEDQIKRIAEKRVRIEISSAMQTIQYQLVTLMTTNGQTPFISCNMYLGEVEDEKTKNDLALLIKEVLRQRIKGLPNEKGVPITPAFPKLLYVLEEDNARPGSKYYELTELAAECTAKRMVPDYISEKMMLKYKGDVYPCMGCRSFLTPDRFTDNGIGNISKSKNYSEGKHKYYGRFNQGVVTINLPDVALSSGGDYNKFWSIFDDRLELCHRALRCRHERLLGTKSDIAPIIWQYGALARLEKGEKIDPLLYHGYSTISLGYAGLYECVKYMTGVSHTDPDGKPFALEVMEKMNDKCNQWKLEEDIDYSVYGTPLESTTYKFAKSLQDRFGIIPGITDKNYITNSYHVHVTEEIDAFTKLSFEAEFQKLSPGGCISYIEVPNMNDNIPAVLSIIEYIYDNIMYAELNTKSDYCQCCGWDGEIKIVEKDGKLIWKCPSCGNEDQNLMSVARRTCGYIGTQYWNQGRTQEIRDRVLHL